MPRLGRAVGSAEPSSAGYLVTPRQVSQSEPVCHRTGLRGSRDPAASQNFAAMLDTAWPMSETMPRTDVTMELTSVVREAGGVTTFTGAL